MPTHTHRGSEILSRLAKWGFPPDVQQRLGAFVVVLTVFESNLETTLWRLRGDDVAGTHVQSAVNTRQRYLLDLP